MTTWAEQMGMIPPIESQTEIITEQQALTKITPIQTPITLSPPSKIDAQIDLYQEREKLKQLRKDLETGITKPSKKITTIIYVTQQVMYIDKIIIDSHKENAITVNNTANIDISTQVNELIKFSRERQCNKNKTPTATS
jgi:hypothetical protein